MTSPSTPSDGITGPKPSLDILGKDGVFSLPEHYVWCGTVEKLPDGRWFLIYSSWPLACGFDGWATHSQVGMAVSNSLLGPFKHEKMLFESGQGAPPIQHNPMMVRDGADYWLLFMGNNGPWSESHPPGLDEISMSNEKWWVHRNNQRVWLAQTRDPLGEWTVQPTPLFEPEAAYLMTTTPFIFRRLDGRWQVVVKTARRGVPPRGGRVEHHIFVSDNPQGPFEKLAESLLTGTKTDFPIDDYCMWTMDGKYYAIVKDHGEGLTSVVPALLMLESNDGLAWNLAADPLVTPFYLDWEDGRRCHYERLEMPRMIFDEGRPVALQLSAYEGNNVKSFNLRVPLK